MTGEVCNDDYPREPFTSSLGEFVFSNFGVSIKDELDRRDLKHAKSSLICGNCVFNLVIVSFFGRYVKQFLYSFIFSAGRRLGELIVTSWNFLSGIILQLVTAWPVPDQYEFIFNGLVNYLGCFNLELSLEKQSLREELAFNSGILLGLNSLIAN